MNSISKPSWLRVPLPGGEEYFRLARLLRDSNLHTVCQEANCPNIGHCFSRRTATFMISGDVCTRNCRYCDVKHGIPSNLDLVEPRRVARAVRQLDLHYVVVTSVTRDDLHDGGAGAFARTIEEIRLLNPDCRVEVLIPDFNGDKSALQTVLDARPDVLNHNIEVVKRLFPIARIGGDYERSLNLLKAAKNHAVTKSGFMVGLGETLDEIGQTMEDLCSVADILTIGQYLKPSKDHMDVIRYYTPGEFKEFKEIGLNMGFKHIESGPLVRSSYHAHEYGI
ncbi:MAG: lipoyl synthase [Candidatus Altiarchaeota archaeon]|nr:lipoyl synthase [Candidatus Altiarchaeota archaeon]